MTKDSKLRNRSLGERWLFCVSRILLLVVVCPVMAQAQTPAKDDPREVLAGKPAPIAVPKKAAGPPISTDPMATLRNAKLIYVKSSSLLVGVSVIESKLRNRPEFEQMGLLITRDLEAADLVLEVEHDVLTKYVFTAVDPKSNVVVASGKLSSLGGTVAGKVAERFLKQMLRARRAISSDLKRPNSEAQD